MATNETTTAPAPTIPGQQDTHFYLLTLQVPTPAGFSVRSWAGTCTPGPGATRYDVYRDLRDHYARQYPECATAAATAFDLQPNQL